MSDLAIQNARAQKQALIDFQAQMIQYDIKLANQDLQIAQLREIVEVLDRERTARIVKNFKGGATS